MLLKREEQVLAEDFSVNRSIISLIELRSGSVILDSGLSSLDSGEIVSNSMLHVGTFFTVVDAEAVELPACIDKQGLMSTGCLAETAGTRGRPI